MPLSKFELSTAMLGSEDRAAVMPGASTQPTATTYSTSLPDVT